MAKKSVVNLRITPSADDFVSAGAEPGQRQTDAQASKREGVKLPEEEKLPKGVIKRTDGSWWRRISLYMPYELAEPFLLRCTKEGVELSDAITKLIVDSMNK